MNFPWLAYSKQENGGFCLPCVLFAASEYRGSDLGILVVRLPCVLFAASEYHGSDLGILVSRPLTTFTMALELLHKHAEDKGYQATTRKL